MRQSPRSLIAESVEAAGKFTFTPRRVIAAANTEDPITDAIRAHAREIIGFVQHSTPAMMPHMRGGSVMSSRGGPVGLIHRGKHLCSLRMRLQKKDSDLRSVGFSGLNERLPATIVTGSAAR